MSRGRPMKYDALLRVLEEEDLYCAASIVNNALKVKVWRIDNYSWESVQRQKMRVRHSLARYSTNHKFPFVGDGLVFMKGQAPQRGWYGWRWKANLV